MNGRLCLISASVKLCILVKFNFKPVEMAMNNIFLDNVYQEKDLGVVIDTTSKLQVNVYKHLERRT